MTRDRGGAGGSRRTEADDQDSELGGPGTSRGGSGVGLEFVGGGVFWRGSDSGASAGKGGASFERLAMRAATIQDTKVESKAGGRDGEDYSLWIDFVAGGRALCGDCGGKPSVSLLRKCGTQRGCRDGESVVSLGS